MNTVLDNSVKHVVGIAYATIILARAGHRTYIYDEGHRYGIRAGDQFWQVFSSYTGEPLGNVAKSVAEGTTHVMTLDFAEGTIRWRSYAVTAGGGLDGLAGGEVPELDTGQRGGVGSWPVNGS